ncbi:MAG: hypothetical protein COA78_27895 [Blastopirellula sp.]|nr:MAG: hypothetical protein COA78_27895 [Blastopirellula sp.]
MISNQNNRRKISLGFTEEPVLEGQHICYLFNNDTERRRVMAKFLDSGIQAGEKLLYLVDTMSSDQMLDCLEELGVDARSHTKELYVTEAAPTYCPDGVFSTENMLDVVRNFYVQAVEDEGYPGARGTGEMSWCLVEGRTDEASLMEYEARLNLLIAENPLTVCCQYDARRFDGKIIMDVLAVHPVMIVRGQLVQNPYYVGAETFLKEYQARAAG